MNYKLKWGFGGLPPITMSICIDCVVYNKYIIHDASPNIAESWRYCVWWGDSAGGPIKRNYTANMIMNVPETVCQFIHYFPCKQVLAINFP